MMRVIYFAISFYNWQNLIIDEFGNHRFRDEYACTIRIQSEYQNVPKRQVRSGQFIVLEVPYPRVVSGNEFTSAQPNPIEFDVEFDYLKILNLTGRGENLKPPPSASAPPPLDLSSFGNAFA